MKYDLIGVALPILILLVAIVMFAAAWLVLGDSGGAATDAAGNCG